MCGPCQQKLLRIAEKFYHENINLIFSAFISYQQQLLGDISFVIKIYPWKGQNFFHVWIVVYHGKQTPIIQETRLRSVCSNITPRKIFIIKIKTEIFHNFCRSLTTFKCFQQILIVSNSVMFCLAPRGQTFLHWRGDKHFYTKEQKHIFLLEGCDYDNVDKDVN